MAKTFQIMQAEVGINVMDYSSALATLSGGWLNNRYFDILRKTNYQAIRDNYEFTMSAGSTMATLPADFGKEVFVYDKTNKTEVDFISMAELLDSYVDSLDDNGEIERYTIVETINDVGQRYKYFKPHYTPIDDTAIRMPYTISPLALASNGGYAVIGCEDAMILGATADAWRFKRQFNKAGDVEMLYEKAINSLTWSNENQPNQIHMLNPKPYSRDTV